MSFPSRVAAWPVVLLALVAGLLAAPAVSASAQSSWAPVSEATITPGVQMVTEGAQCTANFVFTDGSGNVYLGYAAHCAGTGGSTATNGCEALSRDIGTPVDIEGASQPGTLAYSSWLTMQRVDETNSNACNYNDFALVRLADVDESKVNPSVPFWGGPTALGTATSFLADVYSYGNSSLRLGIDLLKPKQGYSLGTMGNGWTHAMYTVTPGIPGDSGSGVMDSQGKAVGALSTLAIAPLAGSNNAADIGKALNYMYTHTSLDSITLEPGTVPFSPIL